MDLKWSQILLILVLFQTSSGAAKDVTVKDGENVNIKCSPGEGSMVVWFRMVDGHSMEFIASFSSNGVTKASGQSFSLFSYSSSSNTLILKSFDKNRDSGTYCCGVLVKGIELKFGEVYQLSGEIPKAPKTVEPTRPTIQESVSTTTTVCPCKEQNKRGATSPAMSCHPIILGALAGGCGLLLLLLIVTTLYCNRIRTRRCPHHYKRKVRVAALEKQQRI